MENEIVKTSEVSENIVSPEHNSFKGYSLEELRYQRALVALQKEFSKNKVLNGVRKISKTGIGYPSKSVGGKAVGLAGKLLSGMNYLDYAMIGLSAFRTARKVFSFFRRKK